MKKTSLILGSMALFGVVSLAVANNTRSEQDAQGVTVEQTISAEEEMSVEAELVGGIASGVMDKAVDNGYGTQKQKSIVENSKIIEKSYQAFRDNNYDPAAAVDKAAEVAVEQGWAKSKSDAKKQLRREIEKVRKNESLVNRVYKVLGL
ncbi:MAG: hypothetical protein MJZ29_09235 [Bacteroidaceae bacterium]|nr:hypothetical protein [Bacteroidaceae bacterium]